MLLNVSWPELRSSRRLRKEASRSCTIEGTTTLRGGREFFFLPLRLKNEGRLRNDRRPGVVISLDARLKRATPGFGSLLARIGSVAAGPTFTGKEELPSLGGGASRRSCRDFALLRMGVADSIATKLSATFEPVHLEVVNESQGHNVARGAETHFRVVVVSKAFAGLALLERHRSINAALVEEFESGLHALSIVAKTPEQWSKTGGIVPPSPPCMGGSGL